MMGNCRKLCTSPNTTRLTTGEQCTLSAPIIGKHKRTPNGVRSNNISMQACGSSSVPGKQQRVTLVTDLFHYLHLTTCCLKMGAESCYGKILMDFGSSSLNLKEMKDILLPCNDCDLTCV